MNCSKTNNSIPFRVTLSLPEFLVSLIRLNLTVFACRRICVTLTPPSFLRFIHLFTVFLRRQEPTQALSIASLCLSLCPSSVTTREGTETHPLPDFETYSDSPHLFPAAIRQTHLSYYTAPAQAHTAMRESARERERERLLEAVAAAGVRRSAPSHLNLFKHE